MSSMARVRELLDEARRALALRERMAVAGDDPREVDEALRGLYHDLGRALVAVVEAGEPVLIEPGAGSALDLAVMPGQDAIPTEMAAPVRVAAPRPAQLSGPDPSDPLADLPGLDPLDDSTPVIPPEREFTAEEPADYVVSTLTEVRAAARVPGSAFHAFHAGGAPWAAELRQLLQLLSLPVSFADAAELAIEASRLQWACSDLAARFAPFPVEIRAALIALLAARAHHLRLRLDSDVGPRLSLDRLQRYRLDSDLPAVAGLTPTPRPETGTWESDARAWWAVLAGEDG